MLWKLFLCFAGIFFSFLLNGYSVESITTSFGEQIFKFYIFMVWIPALFNAFVGKVILWFGNRLKVKNNIDGKDNVPKMFYFSCSVFQMSSMLCANASLAFINYPTQLVLKSSKPIFILAFGMLCLSKKIYNMKRVVSTVIIVFGVTTFMYHQYHNKMNTEKDSKKTTVDIEGLESRTTMDIEGLESKTTVDIEGLESRNHYIVGVSLVLCSLFFDGLLAVTQDKMRSEMVINPNMMMYYVNLYSSGILLVGVLARNELPGFFDFFVSHPKVVFYLLMLGLTSAFGQCFIFYTVATFGPLTCSIITTIRKFFQILLSVILFVHYISVNMWLSVFVVFLGLALDVWTQFVRSGGNTVKGTL